MANGATPASPNPGQSDVNKAVIDQIGKEIQSGADIITSLRTRSAFTVWVGPYIVLGSMLVAVKGGFTVDWSWPVLAGLFLIAAACYIALGYLAGRIERYTLTRSNNLRQCIASIRKDGTLDDDLYLDDYLPGLIVGAYTWVFGILLLCFIGVAVLASGIQPRSAPSDNPSPAKPATAASVTPAPSN